MIICPNQKKKILNPYQGPNVRTYGLKIVSKNAPRLCKTLSEEVRMLILTTLQIFV